MSRAWMGMSGKKLAESQDLSPPAASRTEWVILAERSGSRDDSKMMLLQ
jgi:hypothetical protein